MLTDDDDPRMIASGEAYEFYRDRPFFRADSPEMEQMVKDWIKQRFAEEWRGRWGRLGSSPVDFSRLPGGT